MHFTTMRLTGIRNRPKQIMSASGGLLQTISKPNTGQCVNEDAGLSWILRFYID